MPSLALLFHLVETLDAETSVSLDAARQAADWCDFLELHARKVYAPELQLDLGAAHALALKIRQGAVTTGMTVRDIYNSGWARLKTSENVLKALKVLRQHGWARSETAKTGGRPKQVVRVNPTMPEVQDD